MYLDTNLLIAQLPPLVHIRFQWLQAGRPVAAAKWLHAGIPPHCRRLGGQIESSDVLEPPKFN